MSNLNNIQDFIEKQRSKSSDERMIEANIKAVEDARAKGKSTLTPNQQKIVSRIKEERPQTEEIPLMEKDGGGGGGDGGGGLAGGGTVAVASDPGVFSPTYGGDSKRRLGMQPSKKKKKKKKKKDKDKYHTSGVTKLDRFLRGEKVNQARKSVSVQEFAKWLVDDVRKSLRPENRDTTGGTGVNESPTNETHRGKVRNPWGRGGKFKALTGQQGYTDVQHFVKMENIANTLESQGTVLDLMKALDMDIPVEVN
jgi:hypothetical protein